MVNLFKTLISDIKNLADKQAAYDNIKRKEWPLDKGLKPDNYHELGDDEQGKDFQSTMQLNHYIKHYLFLLLKL